MSVNNEKLMNLYNKTDDIELKKIEDSFASAANYIKKIGWKKNQPCFYKVVSMFVAK